MINKPSKLFATPRGALCIPTGKQRGDYELCQMLPIEPQRFDWIRSSNLRALIQFKKENLK